MSDGRSRRILLVTTDLMASSRIAAAAERLGHTLDVRAAGATADDTGGYDVVLIDVQAFPDPKTAIDRGRKAAGVGGTLVAFGPHVWRDRLEAAVAAGADLAASRGEVLDGLAGLLERLPSG